MFQVLIMICALSTPVPKCQPDTALDVINGPAASNEVQCSLYGQAYLAESLGKAADDEYVKIKCTRTNIGSANIG